MPVMPTPLTRSLQLRYHNDLEFRTLCDMRAVALGGRRTRDGDLHEVALFYDMLDHLHLRTASIVDSPHAHHCDEDPIECSVQAMQGEYEELKRQNTLYKVALKAFALFIRSRQPSLHEYALTHRKTHPDCHKGPHDSYGYRLIKGGVRCLRCGTDVLRHEVQR